MILHCDMDRSAGVGLLILLHYGSVSLSTMRCDVPMKRLWFVRSVVVFLVLASAHASAAENHTQARPPAKEQILPRSKLRYSISLVSQSPYPYEF